MKKFFLLMSVMVLAFGAVGCGGDTCDDGSTQDANGECPTDDSSPEA